MKTNFKIAITLIAGCLAASAAPQLRLTQSALGPLVIPQGTSGPSQTVNAANVGDGTLSLQAASNVAWLMPTVGAPASCQVFGSCFPITIALETSSLATGVYTGAVTVADPNAIDAPQTITVTVQIGSGIPNSLTFYAAPGGSASSTVTAASPIHAASSANWLSVAVNGAGTFDFSVPYNVTASAAGLTANDYNGTIAITGSNSAADNKTVSVLLHVTTSPIAQPSAPALFFRIVQNSINQVQTVSVSNAGQGTLQLGTVTATASSGAWLTAAASGNVVTVTANPTGLGPGTTYSGTLTIASNAANNSITIPVQFEVDSQSGPVTGFQAAVNNATFAAGEAVAPGDIMALFGQQLIYSTPQFASATPLPTQLKGTSSATQVLVNGQPAPLYYASYNQIDFQLPYETLPGRALVQVVRDGQTGNTVSVEVVQNQPRILPFQVGNYGIVQNATEGGFAIPAAAGAALGIANVHPAKAGTDYLTIYALGLGPVTPAVPTGTAAPSNPNPLANTTLTTKVIFISGDPLGLAPVAAASFSGLAPGFVGLYQVNVQVPSGAPKGNSVGMLLVTGGVTSNTVNIAIE